MIVRAGKGHTLFEFIVFMALIVVVMGLGFAFTAAMLSNSRHGSDKCYRGRVQRVHSDAWTQFIYVGKAMVPIFHPASDTDKWVCLVHDKPAERKLPRVKKK